MKACFSLVGRTRFELVTNGLKVRYALPAKPVFPLCAARMDGLKMPFLPAFRQFLPTCCGSAVQWRNAPSWQARGVTSHTIVGKDERHEQPRF